jgi:outer membrane protein, multidrug efflux system
MRRFAFFLFIAVVPLLAGRRSVPKPNVTVPDAFEHQPAGAEPSATEQWWKGFGDPLLEELLERVTRTSLDVRQAGARLAEAGALRGSARSALLPNFDATGSAARLRGGFNEGVVKVPNTPGASGGSFVTPFDSTLLSTGFNMRWEADILGGLRKSLDASAAEQRSAAEDVRYVQVLVRAELARNYIEMRATQEQTAIVEANVAAEQDLLNLVRSRADAGLASQLDVDRQMVELASARAVLPDLDTQWLRAAHRIAVLLGDYPASLLDRLRPAASTKLAVPPVPHEVPSEVLRRRADIRRADARIAAAYARAGAARADLYPKLVITGLSGRQATELSGITIGAGNFFSVGPGISLPILNFGRIRSNIAAQDARLEQAVRSYEQEVLAAFEETENAFVVRDRAELRLEALHAGLEAAQRSVALARELYVRGLSDFLTVLDAERQQFRIEREFSACQGSVLLGTVALYKALGE